MNVAETTSTPTGLSQNRLYVMGVGIVRILFVIANNLYCIPVHMLWLFLLQPIRLLAPNIYWTIEGIFYRWLLSMVAMWSYSAGYDIVEKGDNVWELANDRTCVMYNHQSTSDVPLIMASYNNKGLMTSSVMWIMDQVFKLTNFGICSWMHGDFFIRAGKAHRDTSLQSLSDHLSNFYGPRKRKWIVLFPEGGFLVNRLSSSWKFGQKLGLPHLQYVSLPRMGALKVILDHAAENPINGVRWVVDVTVGYPQGDPLNLQTLIAGWRTPCSTVMHYRCYSASQIPRDDKGLGNWLLERYIEKERMLREYYDTGVFPDAPSPAYATPAPLPPEIKLRGSLSKDKLILEEHNCLETPGSIDIKNTCESLNSGNTHDAVLKSNFMSSTAAEANCVQLKTESEAVQTSAPVNGSPFKIHNSDGNNKENSVQKPCNNSYSNDDDHISSSILSKSKCCSTSTEKLNLINSSRNSNCCDSLLPDSTTSHGDTVNNNSPKHSSIEPSRLSTNPITLPNSESERIPLYPETQRPKLGKLNGTCLQHDYVEFILRHFFYIASTYVALNLLWHFGWATISFLC